MLALEQRLQERYRVLRPLGQGGMGTVYEAVDERFRRGRMTAGIEPVDRGRG